MLSYENHSFDCSATAGVTEAPITRNNPLTNSVSKISEFTKKLFEGMEKYVFSIEIGGEQCTGFFCKIPFPKVENLLPVFITNNHLINRDLISKKDVEIEIYIKSEGNVKKINLDNRMKYTNEE